MAIAADLPGHPKSARDDECRTSATFTPRTVADKARGGINQGAYLGPRLPSDQVVTYEAAIEVLMKVGHDDIADELHLLKNEHVDSLHQLGGVKGTPLGDRADVDSQRGRRRGFGRGRCLNRGGCGTFGGTRFGAPKPKDPVAVLPLPEPEPTRLLTEPIIPLGTGPHLASYLRTRNNGEPMPTWSCSCPSCFGYEKYMQELEGRFEDEKDRKKEERKVNELATKMVLECVRGGDEEGRSGGDTVHGGGDIGEDVKELIEGVITCRLSREKKTK